MRSGAGQVGLAEAATTNRHREPMVVSEESGRFRFQRQVQLCHLSEVIRNCEMRVHHAAAAALSFLALAGSVSQAQTLRRPIPPCHSLTLSVPPDTECFDDLDRDGEFQYNRGDRAYRAKDWIQYQWNLY